MKRPQKQGSRSASVREQLEADLRDLKLRLAQAYAGFNTALDSELVESYIYEIQSLQARYSYVLRQRKALDSAPAASTAKGRSHPRRGAHDPLPVA